LQLYAQTSAALFDPAPACQVKDDEPASSRLQGTEEVMAIACVNTYDGSLPSHLSNLTRRLRQVIFFMEIAEPPKRARAGAVNSFAGPGMFGMPGGRGSGGMPAASSGAAGLAAQLMQRMQQAQQQPQGGPAQVSLKVHCKCMLHSTLQPQPVVSDRLVQI
jgi:hypothetical protein